MNKIILLSILALYVSSSQAEPNPSCESLFAAGDYAKATEIGKHPQGFSDSMCLGKALRAQDKYSEAYQSFIDAEKAAPGAFEQVMAVIYQARAVRDSGQAPQAMSLYQRGLELSVKNKLRQGQLVCLNEPGQILLDQHDAKAAMERFNQAFALASNDNERATANELMASAYRQMADYDHAIEHQLRATNQERASGDLNHYLYATLELAAIRTDAKNFDAAQRNIDEALDQSRSGGSAYWEAKSLLYQGRLEKAKGNTSQAQTLFVQSSVLAAKVGEPTLVNDIALELKQGK